MQFETFGIEKEPLRDLLGQIYTGQLQLPEFQRKWVWAASNVAGLIASISQGHPVGSLMLLRTGGPVRFLTRHVQGAPSTHPEPDRLILDGQQRLTALYQALRGDQPVEINNAKGGPKHGWFYIDIAKALDNRADREDSIVFVPADKYQQNHRPGEHRSLAAPEDEYEHRMFPCTALLDPMPWAMGFWNYGQATGRTDAQQVWQRFFDEIIQRVSACQLAVIDLDKSIEREAVCQVFERVNQGGVTLTVFDLMTASFAAHGISLRDDVNARREGWAADQRYQVLSKVTDTDFLQVICLARSDDRRWRAVNDGTPAAEAPRVGCKRADILALDAEAYATWADRAEQGLLSAAQFLTTQHVRNPRYLPYASQLVPLAAILVALGQNGRRPDLHARLAQWYWCGVFGELYGSSADARAARDVTDVLDWMQGTGPLPSTIKESLFHVDRLWEMRTATSPAYKGIYCLLLGLGAVDWRTDGPVRDIASNGGFVDIHHIFPQAWCESRKVSKDDYNCILNKTPLSPPTNVLIGGHAPSIYTKQLEAEARIDADELNGRLATHLIEPVHLRDDKFRPMLDARAKALLDLIDTVTGKKSIRTRSATSKKKWTALDEPTSALRTLAEQPA